MPWHPRAGRLRQTDYIEADDYARDLRAGGGPDRDGLGFSRAGSGLHAAVLRAVWGGSEEEFLAALIAEEEQAQRARPHAFVRKWRGGRRKGRRSP